ncbi:MAG: response regulator, partial [bacterium]|nr:response regulator [bacterium]
MLESHLRFLILEDQGDLRRAMMAMLKNCGVGTVQGVNTDEEGIEVLKNKPIDFILCSWSIPAKGGIEFLKLVRKIPMTMQIPFIMISGRGQLDNDDFAQTNDYDVDGHLIKPLNQQEIEEKIQSVLEKYTFSMEANIALARAHAFVDIEAYDEAKEELQVAHEAGKNSPQVLTQSGQVYERMGDTEKAQACYEEATNRDEYYTKAYDHLGDLLQKKGEPDAAHDLFQRAAKISPKNSDRQMKLAKTLMAKGDEEGARIALHRAVEGEADPASRNAAVAEFFLANNRADLAEEEFGFALAADPENVHYYNRLGMAFRRQRKFKEAIDNYRKAMAVVPSDAVLYYNMAL